MAKKTKTPRLIYPIGEKSVNQVIAERTIKHQAFLQQFANSEIVKIDALLLDAESDILAQMARRMAKITKRGRDIGPVTTRRLVEMFHSFSQITRTSTQEIYNLLKGDLIDLSYDEVDALQDVFDKSAPITLEMQLPSPATLRAIVVTEPFEGKVMRKWFSEIGQNTQRGLEQSVRMGMTQGETIDQIASRIRGVYGRTNHNGIRNEAARTARTAVNHVSTEARHSTFEANADLIKGYQWFSTLDSRTCLICSALDGRVYKLDNPRRPPEHFSCRCTIAPLLKPWRELGVDRDDLTPKQRASMNGQVSGTLTYADWFKSKELSASDRQRILGPTRYKRWKAGKEDIKQFTNSGGKIHTIEHLQDLEKRREKAKMIPRRRAAQKKARN